VLSIESDLLLDVAPSHLHLAHVRIGSGAPRERLLTEADPSWAISAAPAGSPAHYLRLGLRRAFTGWDHLACLAALLLVAGSLAGAVRIAVSFSLACSIALALAVFARIQPAGAPLQALIGLSVALVAAENLWLRGGRDRLTPLFIAAAIAALAAAAAAGRLQVPALALAGAALFAGSYFELARRAPHLVSARTALAFLFGALHGLGLATALSTVDSSASAAPLGAAVLGFNAGAELVLLAAAAAVWLLVRAAKRLRGDAGAVLVDFGSAAALAGGVFWFASRIFS